VTTDRVPATLLMMVGGHETSAIEQMVTSACRLAAADTIERTLASGAYQHWIVATNSPSFAEALHNEFPGIKVSLDEGEFHFGRRLRDLVASHGIEAPVYCGGGAGILLDTSALAWIADRVATGPGLLVCNNLYSSDLCGFRPGSSLDRIDPPDTDNDLAWRLATQAGMQTVVLPRGAAALMDIDTPTDLLTLQPHPGVGPRLRSFLDGLALNRGGLEGVLRVLRTPGARVALAGRVGSAACRYLQDRTGCRVIPYSEERGLRASGRQWDGKARSMLAFLAARVGWAGVMESIAEVADALLFDTRVVMAHDRQWPSAADRFWSDCMRPDCVEDSDLRSLTEAARDARIPVMLGGHSIVSGGLYTLVDACTPAPRHTPER
jgi:hypothetical protein